MYNNGFQVTSENTLREFPLVIATVAKVSRKRGLWLVVRVKKFPAGQTGVIISLVCLAGSISTCVRKCQDHFLHIFSRSDHSHLLQIGSDRYFISAKISRPGMNSVRVRAVIPVILPWIRSQLLFHNKCR